jgi:hypothetical protein
MSRGPGRIESIITEAMLANPSAIFTVPDLVALAYPDAPETLGIQRLRWGRYVERPYIEKRYRSAIHRAAKKAVPRAGWNFMKVEAPGGPPVFYNPCDLASYYHARLRADRLYFNYPDRLAQQLATPDEPHRKLLASGTGTWWREVEERRLRRDGRNTEADAILDQLGREFDELEARVAGWRRRSA